MTVPGPLRNRVIAAVAGHGVRNSLHVTVNDSEHAGLHLRGDVPIAGADRAAVVFPAAAGVMSHQLVDHAGRDTAVLQPGREGVP